MNTITWKAKALKQTEKIRDAAIRRKIFIEVKTLTDFPDCRNVKKLVNHLYQYRLRVANYRVFFDFDGEIKIIDIQEVKKRDEATY